MSRQRFDTTPGTLRPSDWHKDLGFQRDDLGEEVNGVREENDPNYIFAFKPKYVCPECRAFFDEPEDLGPHLLEHEPEYDPLDLFYPKPCPKCGKVLEGGNLRRQVSDEDYKFHVALCRR
jgi:hypothetical protein